jgi:polyphosphate kinase
MGKMSDLRSRFVNRDLSWLQFNARVLQEAEDERNPLIERLRFLGIFSNNLDEFFRVRYASIQRMSHSEDVKKVKETLGGWAPNDLIQAIQNEVNVLNDRVELTYAKLMAELEQNGVKLVDESELTQGQKDFIRKFYIEKVSPTVFAMILQDHLPFPELNDATIYLAIRLWPKRGGEPVLSLVEVPAEIHGRFIELPKYGSNFLMFLDDVLRHNIQYAYFLFPSQRIEAYTFKISRDADLDLDHHDVSRTVLDRVRRGLEDRKVGDPVRMVYDRDMPAEFLAYLIGRIGLENNDAVIAGGRYHNKKDLMRFPNVGKPSLEHPRLEPLQHPDLDMERSLMHVVRQKDVLLFLPYHNFLILVRFLREAAIDMSVTRISITLYRLASQSRIISALINAAKNGKKVRVVIELQARFDEENNLHYLEKMRKVGIEVQTGVEGLKVHSKIVHIERVKPDGGLEHFAVVGTGNFNEGSARFYTDYHLLTANPTICADLDKVFEFLYEPFKVVKYKELLVSPHYSRAGIIKCLDREIAHAKKGIKSEVIMKFNSLSSFDIGEKLYEASKAGVKVRLLVRGVCCVRPGVKGLSENIEVVSIIDRFLEHSRVYYFSNGGKPLMYLASFDMMTRNLDLRVEVAAPVLDPRIQREIMDHLEIQFRDNVKARVYDEQGRSVYRSVPGPRIRSQMELYEYVKKQAKKRRA